mmetsp:Transcript_74549/g.177481  ORF Transcript_74549/g.177481 Transcript_74549/m.177481 type:complete len:223 (+) Transcript_74549:366-1034(+)
MELHQSLGRRPLPWFQSLHKGPGRWALVKYIPVSEVNATSSHSCEPCCAADNGVDLYSVSIGPRGLQHRHLPTSQNESYSVCVTRPMRKHESPHAGQKAQGNQRQPLAQSSSSILLLSLACLHKGGWKNIPQPSHVLSRTKLQLQTLVVKQAFGNHKNLAMRSNCLLQNLQVVLQVAITALFVNKSFVDVDSNSAVQVKGHAVCILLCQHLQVRIPLQLQHA